jgi:hypothetical protein
MVKLSAGGRAFLDPARRLVVGISHHVVGTGMAFALRRISAADPGLVIGPHINASKAVLPSRDVMLFSRPSDTPARLAQRTLGAAFATTAWAGA